MKDRKSPRGAFNHSLGVKPQWNEARVDSTPSARSFERPMFNESLMEEVCERENMKRALKRVISNKGSAGVDGMKTDEISDYLRENWSVIRSQLLAGVYIPHPVKRVAIPKPGSREKRMLGIPSCIDRLIQQAVLQVLQPEWDPCFSDNSFGFRPGRSCHDAIDKAQEFLLDGNEFVVDMDLSKFFDRVCHDRLMTRLMAMIPDRRALQLIRSYLKAGFLENGLINIPTEGTPQGGPLSPFLSNIVLDELDKELESRGLSFVRYADDLNIYVQSLRAGQRVMFSVTQFIESKLKLKVNKEKSAVDKPKNRKFLGFTFTGGRKPNRRKISPESIVRFRMKVRELTRRNSGVSMCTRIVRLSCYLRGWKGYYGHCETESIYRDLDSWIRRKLRCVQWKSWKTYKRRKKELLRLGVSVTQAQTTANSSKGPWQMSHTPGVRLAMPNRYFDALGLFRLDSR